MTSCQSGQKSGTDNKTQPDIHTAVVLEVLQAGQYTYLRVKEGEAELWLAVTAISAEVGKTYYYKDGMEMTNFHSKELNRDFATVYFIDAISTDPNMPSNNQNVAVNNNASGAGDMAGKGGKPTIEKQKVNVTPASGGITIAELFSKKDQYAGKTVKIKGQVTKFSPEIMNTNWIHIQDGTESGGEFDLTITSALAVQVGNVVIVEGKISLDKDFGFGYFYKVIMEDATITK